MGCFVERQKVLQPPMLSRKFSDVSDHKQNKV